MRGERFFLVAGLVVISALLLTGCSNEAPTTPAAPAPTAVSPSPTPSLEPTEPADEYAIPDDPAEIDKAYVERVLEALLTSVADAARQVVREGEFNAETREILASSHRGESLRGIVRALRSGIRAEAPEDVFNADARHVDVTVSEIMSASGSCIWTLVQLDTGELVGQEIEPFPTYYYLVAKRPQDDPEADNPTAWMIAGDAGPPEKGEEYDDPCA